MLQLFRFYLATTPQNPNYRQVHKNNQCLTCNARGPEDVTCTHASASFSKDLSYYAMTCSGPTPTYVKIYRSADVK